MAQFSTYISKRITKLNNNTDKHNYITIITPGSLERTFGPSFGVFFGGGEAGDGEGDGLPQPPQIIKQITEITPHGCTYF